MTALTLWIPQPPDNANARQHWAVALKAKKAYQAMLTDRAKYRYHIPTPPPTPLQKATIQVDWYYPDKRYHIDPDNAIRRLKPACDWLVKAGYLANDTGDHVTWLPVAKHVGEQTPALCTVKLTISEAA